MPRRKEQIEKKRPDIVSVHLSPEAKLELDEVCRFRGMTIKVLLGRLITWFVELDKTEQAIVLGHIDNADVEGLCELILRRKQHSHEEPVMARRGA
jgi:hypothetical protein